MPNRTSEPSVRRTGILIALVCVTIAGTGEAIAQETGKERQYVQLSIVGEFNAGMNTVSAAGKPKHIAARFAVDFSRFPRLASEAEALNGKTIIIRGSLVQCTNDGKNGTPKCDRNRSRSGLFLQPISIKEYRKPSGQVSEKDHSVSVVCRGRIHSDVVALGGETTGFTIELDADGEETWELDLQKKQSESARQFNNRTVLISGTLSVRKGMAIPERWIVAVRNLVAE